MKRVQLVRWCVLFGLTIMSVCVCFATAQESHYGGTMTIASRMDALALDGALTNDMASRLVMEQIYDQLIDYDPEFNFIPKIATSWEVSSEGLIWTFTIREGVKCHDGSILTPEDVAFSYTRILEDAANKSGKREYIGSVDSVTVVDGRVQFVLKQEDPAFLTAIRVVFIVPQHAVEAVGLGAFGRNPVGTGPFKFKEWLPDDHITLERFDDYWMKRPYLDEVVFRPIPESGTSVMSLLAGEVDAVEQVLPETLPQLQANTDIQMMGGSSMNYHYISFRCDQPPTSDVRFRKMVYYAVDMDGAIAAILPYGAGVRAYAPTPPGFWPRDLEYMRNHAIQQDKVIARALFDELVRDGVMKRDQEVRFVVYPDTNKEKLAEIVVIELRSIGVNAKLVTMEWGAFLDYVLRGGGDGDSFIAMIATSIPKPDPDGIIYYQFSSEADGGDHGREIWRFPQPEMNELLRQTQTIVGDQDVRSPLYTSIQRLAILEEVFHIPAYHLNQWVPVSKRVHDLGDPPFCSWWIVTPFSNAWVDKD